MWTLRLSTAAVIAALLAAGCGGGGGGVDEDTTPTPPSQVQITLVNQDSVARAAITSILPFASLPSVDLQTSPAPLKAANSGLAALALRAAAIGKQQPAAGDIVRTFAAYTETESCALSGTITWTIDDVDNSNTFTAGDTILLAFNQCSEDPDTNLNGRFTMAISSISETPTEFNLAGSLTLDRLTMRDVDAVLIAHGALNFTIKEFAVADGMKKSADFTVASSGLTVGASGMAAGYSDTFVYFAGYRVTQLDYVPSVAGVPGTSQITADGKLHSDTLNGEMTLHTLLPFKLVEPENNPSEGQLEVIGNNNTKLEMTALPGAMVRMNVCDDGDGVWEGTKTVAWDEMIP